METVKHNCKIKSRRSFSLLEVVIALTVIMMFLGSAVTLNTLSLKNATVSQHRYQAAELARQGMDIVKEIRDMAFVWPGGSTWDDLGNPANGCINLRRECWGQPIGGTPCSKRPEITDTCFAEPHYRLVDGNEVIRPSVGKTGAINADIIDYTRSINIVDVPTFEARAIKRVTVRVEWQDFGKTYNYEMYMYLTNWKSI